MASGLDVNYDVVDILDILAYLLFYIFGNRMGLTESDAPVGLDVELYHIEVAYEA